MPPSTLNISMQICLCGDSPTDDAFEKVVEMTVEVKSKDTKFLSEKD